MNTLLRDLKAWRQEQAWREGIEPFRVLSNSAIEEIAELLPQTHEELLAVKGIKERKFERYGAQILEIIREHILLNKKDDHQNSLVDELAHISVSFPRPPKADPPPAEKRESRVSADWIPDPSFAKAMAGRQVGNDKTAEEKVFTVSQFLDLLNIGLRASEAKIVGEVSSCDFRGTYLFFTLKDAANGSAINCFMWQREYRMSGVSIAEGMEIMVHGFPEIYKPSGRLSFRGDSLELVGEGALKKAYDELKLKLEREGLFAPERKRPIPGYPEKIGLITSKTGAVIHDFLNNIGKFGYQIRFIDSRVEGQLAMSDLLSAVRSFRNKDIDVLVIIRGGGSLESLLAFNNEMLVREISRFPKPVICGIGHDKDVPLAALAADIAVSTPTAAAHVLDSSWEQALSRVRLAEQEIFGAYQEALLRMQYIIKSFLGLPKDFSVWLETMSDAILQYEKHMILHNPERQLRLGYSIARIRGNVIRSIHDARAGDPLDLTLADGMIGTEVKEVKSD